MCMDYIYPNGRQNIEQTQHISELPTTSNLSHLMNFLPPVFVFTADGGVFVEQQFAAEWIPPHDGRVVQGGQPTAVLVVGRCSKL